RRCRDDHAVEVTPFERLVQRRAHEGYLVVGCQFFADFPNGVHDGRDLGAMPDAFSDVAGVQPADPACPHYADPLLGHQSFSPISPVSNDSDWWPSIIRLDPRW